MSQTKAELLDGKSATVNLKNPATADNSTMNLVLQTGETDIAADDVIGKISFQAPDEGTGTDAILVSAAIQATSEGDFSSSSNATKLEFMTGASEAAAEKMTLTSGGVLNVTKLGVGTDHDLTNAGIHIRTADSGASNVNNADDLVIEGSGVAGISIFTGTSSAGQINFGDSGANERGKLLYDHNGDDMDFYTNSSHQWSIDSSGHLLPAATDHGIYLGVTSATASNLLDDYEEGTWTATCTGGLAGDPTATCHYTKIGRVVYIASTFNFASGNFAAENIILTGLPFATATDGDATADNTLRAKMFGFVQRTDVQAESVTFWSVDSAGGTTLTLRYMGDNASTGQIQGVAASSVTPNFTISGFYFTDS